MCCENQYRTKVTLSLNARRPCVLVERGDETHILFKFQAKKTHIVS